MEKRLNLWISRVERVSAWSAGILVVVNIGDVLLGIFFRYVLGSSIIWTEELARFSLVWLVMLGAAGALLRGDHMYIDFVLYSVPMGLRHVLEWMRRVITLVMLCLMIWLGTVSAMETWQMRTMALDIPKAIPLLSIPVGFFLLLVMYTLMELRFLIAGRNAG